LLEQRPENLELTGRRGTRPPGTAKRIPGTREVADVSPGSAPVHREHRTRPPTTIRVRADYQLVGLERLEHRVTRFDGQRAHGAIQPSGARTKPSLADHAHNAN